MGKREVVCRARNVNGNSSGRTGGILTLSSGGEGRASDLSVHKECRQDSLPRLWIATDLLFLLRVRVSVQLAEIVGSRQTDVVANGRGT